MYPVSQWKWVPRPGAAAEAKKLLQPSIRFEMRECTDVPPCTEQMRDVELSDDQKKYFKQLQRDCVLAIGDRQITAAHEAALRLKLIQISCGAVYDSNHTVTRIDCAPRLQELRTVVEEAARKIIVLAPLTSVLHLLYDALAKDYNCEIINGERKTKDRDRIFKSFQDDADPQILIADPATMSHGLDLYRASVCVWYGATDRTELYLQANRRIDRPGQTVPTTIVQLAATSIEREIYRRAANNQAMQGLILGLVKEQI
jgi:SNF2 family DNA or RNA helicase